MSCPSCNPSSRPWAPLALKQSPLRSLRIPLAFQTDLSPASNFEVGEQRLVPSASCPITRYVARAAPASWSLNSALCPLLCLLHAPLCEGNNRWPSFDGAAARSTTGEPEPEAVTGDRPTALWTELMCIRGFSRPPKPCERESALPSINRGYHGRAPCPGSLKRVSRRCRIAFLDIPTGVLLTGSRRRRQKGHIVVIQSVKLSEAEIPFISASRKSKHGSHRNVVPCAI